MVKVQASERPCLQQKVDGTQRYQWLSSDLHTHTNVRPTGIHKPPHKHICIHMYQKDYIYCVIVQTLKYLLIIFNWQNEGSKNWVTNLNKSWRVIIAITVSFWECVYCCKRCSCTVQRFVMHIGLVNLWLASSQAKSIGRATRLGEFWEEEKQRCSQQQDVEETRWECLTEKKYQVTWLNMDENYGLI